MRADPTASALFLGAFFDELERWGVHDVVVLSLIHIFIAQYAADYPEINYLVKMNSKTNIVGGSQDDPYSPQLYDLDAVLAMREAGVNIVGIGYTIYLGSEYEMCIRDRCGGYAAEGRAGGA